MGGKTVAKGTGKNSSKGATVIKPWDKTRAVPTSTRAVPTSTRGFSSGSAVVAPWTIRAEKIKSGASERYDRAAGGKGKGKSGKGKGKGKDKGKGKRRGAAPKDAQFWVRKVEEENRSVIDSEPLTGVVEKYVWEHGWGFIMPDNVDELPADVRQLLKEATHKLKEAGKNPGDENLLYFRKPDVQGNFRIKDKSQVAFKVYTDDKGAGACEVCDPNAEEDEEANE